MNKPKIYILLLLPFFVLFSCEQKQETNTQTSDQILGPTGKNGVVVSAHPLASQVGLEVLKNGGTAVDAAIAVKFALAVVYPGAGNIGGGGFVVYRRAEDSSYHTLDFREKAPAQASRDMYLDEEKNVIENLSTRGHLAAGVPGSVDGMVKFHEKFATKDWKELVQPSIDLAANGFELTEKEAGKLNYIKEDLITYNTVKPENIIKEEEWKKGDTVYYKDLAQTLTLIRDQGRDGFYAGATADFIVEEMNRGNGLITHEDLMNYESIWRDPIIGYYKGKYKIISMPPASSGGIALNQLLSSVEDLFPTNSTHNDAQVTHLMAEAERRVYADRAQHLGDGDFWTVPKEMLLDPVYNKERMSSFNPDMATNSDSIAAGKYIYESEATTHFSVIDKDGNAVSITTTLNGGFGNRVFVAGAGFFLNNEMDDFSVKPGSPNIYGLVGGEANAIEPNKRMLSSMTPTIVEEDGKLKMIVGSPGGSTIITSVFQTILNVVEYDMTMQEAVNAKRFHHQWIPDLLMHETNAFDEATTKDLEAKGHKLYERSSIGRVDAILVHTDGTYEGGADPRGDDTALAY